jgi:hypothetical protein
MKKKAKYYSHWTRNPNYSNRIFNYAMDLTGKKKEAIELLELCDKIRELE